MDSSNSAQSEFDQLVDAIDNLETKLTIAFNDNLTMLKELKDIARQRLDSIRIGSQADTTHSNFDFYMKDGLKYLLCYTDGSFMTDKMASNSKRFALAAFFGPKHPLNFAKICTKKCVDVFSSEVAAVVEAMQTIRDQTSERRVLFLIDNLEAKKLLEAILLEKKESALLPDLIASNPFLKSYATKARELVPFFLEIRLTWVKAHTASRSHFSVGNAAADSLVKECLRNFHSAQLSNESTLTDTTPDTNDPSDPETVDIDPDTPPAPETQEVSETDIETLLI